MDKRTIEVWAPVLTREVAAPASTLAAPAAPSLDFEIEGLSTTTQPFKLPSVLGKMKAYHIDMSLLTNNLRETLADFQKMMDGIPKSASGYCIEEIELNLGVTGNGGIALIGKLDIGVEAAIKIKIKRESTT